MAGSVAFANRGVLSVAGWDKAVGTAGRVVTVPSAITSTDTDSGLGVVKDAEITWSAEHVPLYGWGSTKRQAVAKHSQKVAVKIGWVKFDPIVTTGWQFYMLGTASSAGTWSSPTGVVTDTNAVKLFNVTALWTMEDGRKLLGTVTNVFFPDMPLKAAEGQWVKVDMSGEGDDIVWTNPV